MASYPNTSKTGEHGIEFQERLIVRRLHLHMTELFPNELFSRVRTAAKSACLLRHVRLSVLTNVSARITLDGLP